MIHFRHIFRFGLFLALAAVMLPLFAACAVTDNIAGTVGKNDPADNITDNFTEDVNMETPETPTIPVTPTTPETPITPVVTDPNKPLTVKEIVIISNNRLVVRFSEPVAAPDVSAIKFFWGWIQDGKWVWDNCTQPDGCGIKALNSTNWEVEMNSASSWPNDYFWGYYQNKDDAIGCGREYGVGVKELRTLNDNGFVDSVKSADGSKMLTANFNTSIKADAGSASPDVECFICTKISYKSDYVYTEYDPNEADDPVSSGDTQIEDDGRLKILFLGNSLTKHSPAPSIGWNGNYGMAASCAENDYVHRTVDCYAAADFGSINFKTGFIADFERAIVANDTFDYSSEGPFMTLLGVTSRFMPDVVVIQMGENVGSNPSAVQYANAVGQLIDGIYGIIPGVKIVLCTPFWGGDAKINGIKSLSSKYEIPYADLAALNSPENKALGLFEHAGVADHPGDKGMDNIAKLVYAKLKPILEEISK